MRRILLAVLGVAGLVSIGFLIISKAAERVSASVYVVTHVDVIGSGGKLAEALRLVRQFVADSRTEAGVVRFEALQQEGHPNHFTIFEVWQNRNDMDAHLAAEHTKRFREALQPMLGSPFREHLHRLAP